MSMSRPGTVAVLAGTLLFALAACGSPTSGNTNASTGMGSLAPTASAASTVPSSVPANSTPSPVPSPTPSVVITTVSGDTVLFATPSGNIGCALSADNVRCDIGDRTWTAPPKPSTCQLDYGNGLVLSGSGAAVSCAGDTLLHATTNVLAYGHGLRDGLMQCVSQSSGVRCDDLGTGHGFTLAKENYTLF